jgi:hypothetical protein
MSIIQFRWFYIVSEIHWAYAIRIRQKSRDSLASNEVLNTLGTVAIISIPLLSSPNVIMKSAINVNTNLNMLNKGLNSPIPT